MERTATAGRCGFLEERRPETFVTCWSRRLTAAIRRTGLCWRSTRFWASVRLRSQINTSLTRNWSYSVINTHVLLREMSGGPRGRAGGSGNLVPQRWHEVRFLQKLRQVRVLQETDGTKRAACHSQHTSISFFCVKEHIRQEQWGFSRF